MAVTSERRATARADRGGKARKGQKRAGGDRAAPQVSGERLLEMYRKMVLVRVFEEATLRGFRQGKIGGYLHVYIGQEAVALGFIDAYQPGDAVITAYRDHAHAVVLGSDPKAVRAEL